MKASKALKRLTKIEGLMSDVMEKYVTLAPAVRKALHDAIAAVAVAKEAVSLDASHGTAKDSPVKESGVVVGSPKVKRKSTTAKEKKKAS